MRKAVFLFMLIASLTSCNRPAVEDSVSSPSPDGIIIARDIIYDVVIKAETDDPWEKEKVAGYNGDEMINRIFESAYSGKLRVIDYHTRETLSRADLRKIEEQQGFERENIGKIQFTEDWYFNPENNSIDKRTKSVVFGYKSISEDLGRVGYLAAFEVMLQ